MKVDLIDKTSFPLSRCEKNLYIRIFASLLEYTRPFNLELLNLSIVEIFAQFTESPRRIEVGTYTNVFVRTRIFVVRLNSIRYRGIRYTYSLIIRVSWLGQRFEHNSQTIHNE